MTGVQTCALPISIAGISTGTNNAFPEHRVPTVTGLATGLAAMGRVPGGTAFADVPDGLGVVLIKAIRVDLAESLLGPVYSTLSSKEVTDQARS